MQVTVTSSSKKMIAKLQRKEQRKGQATGAKGSVADQDMELLQVWESVGSVGIRNWPYSYPVEPAHLLYPYPACRPWRRRRTRAPPRLAHPPYSAT